MDSIFDRHAGTLGDRLVPMDQADRASVVVSIAPELANLPACQHTAWMLINLLARADGIVDRVALECPRGVELAGRIVPLADRHLDLFDALISGAAAVDAVPVSSCKRVDPPTSTSTSLSVRGSLRPARFAYMARGGGEDSHGARFQAMDSARYLLVPTLPRPSL